MKCTLQMASYKDLLARLSFFFPQYNFQNQFRKEVNNIGDWYYWLSINRPTNVNPKDMKSDEKRPRIQ